MILVSIKEKETKIIREENKWAREEKDKARPTWSAWAGPREKEREKRDAGEQKMKLDQGLRE